MILEGIVTTTNEDGSVNVSPMGPVVDEERFSCFCLRPFQTSTTYRNLKRTGQGVLHVTDDVNLFVDGALRDFEELPETEPANSVEGFVLQDCCRYFEFKVTHLNDADQRTEIECAVVKEEQRRPFWGFNRAKHAVLEAAILATRLHILDRIEVETEIRKLDTVVEKTAGANETRAFAKVKTFVTQHYLENLQS